MKMKYTKLKYSFLFLFSALLVNSCSDDFVNVDSLDVNSENYFNSKEDYEAALIGAYDLLQSSYLNVRWCK